MMETSSLTFATARLFSPSLNPFLISIPMVCSHFHSVLALVLSIVETHML